MTEEEFRACAQCPYLLVTVNTVSIETRGYEQLSEYVNDFDERQDTLIAQTIQFYSSMHKSIELFGDELTEDITDNLKRWRHEKTWLADYIVSGRIDEEFYEYALNDPEFKNLVAYHYVILYNNYVPLLRAFKTNTQYILREIEERTQ